MTVSNKQSKKRAGSRERKKNVRGKTTTKLLVAMTGKASPAKPATGDEPVFAYIASLPQPQAGGPAFGPQEPNHRGCPVLAFFARAGTMLFVA